VFVGSCLVRILIFLSFTYTKERLLTLYHMMRFDTFASDARRRRSLRKAWAVIADLVASSRAIYMHELMPHSGQSLERWKETFGRRLGRRQRHSRSSKAQIISVPEPGTSTPSMTCVPAGMKRNGFPDPLDSSSAGGKDVSP
jgi:hypothetical protein